MYKKVDSSLDFVPRELEVLEFWKKHDIVDKSLSQRKGNEIYSFYEGPPTANGEPHTGHVLTRVIKDLIPRYRTMKGYFVPRKAGWDTHGLPVELEVEKKLGLNGKEHIEEYGVEKFIAECKKSVWKYLSEWEEMTERVGFWVDMDNAYITYENDYIESVWWALKEIWKKNLIYKGHRVVPYCPRCGTALSSHEVAQGYKDIKETSIYVRMPVVGEENTYFAVWTTTPWTLPSNVALCVNEAEEYALVEVAGCPEHDVSVSYYYLATALVGEVFGEDAKVIRTMPGSELLNKRYMPVFDYANKLIKDPESAFYVIADPYVNLEDGTGIVHIAPAFGEDDARLGREHNLPHVQLVDLEGKLTAETGEFAGVFVKDADPKLIQDLEKRGLLLFSKDFEHSYPFCWRCDTALLYYARSGWFIEMTEVRDRLVENNKQINWIPKNIGTGRFGNFLDNVVDWNLSRERYWGTPLPIWECEACAAEHCVGSIEELRQLSPEVPEDIELHKPGIDQVHFACKECGGRMTRVPEVIDCWFDSGAMPFAQYHYPFENKEIFESSAPADFISEAIDQTRGWFYTLHAISTLLFDRPAYKTCLVLGHVLDGEGIKMSKHLGNVIHPRDIFASEGADATRWAFFTTSQPWLPTRFSEETVNEGKRRFMGTLWNTYAFFVLYANIDEFEAQNYDRGEYASKRTVIDRWILSRLNSLFKDVDSRLDKTDITGASRCLQKFLDELSNWYVRRSRERYWGPEMDDDKIVAYLTLYEVLEKFVRLIAPFTPFISEMIYQNIVVGHLDSALESVHFENYPEADESLIDEELERDMDLLLELVSLGRAARNTAQLKIRQPLAKAMVVGGRELPAELLELVKDELNIKDIEFGANASELIEYEFKPQLRTLGKRMGKDLNKARELIAGLPGHSTMDALRRGETIALDVDGTVYDLAEEDLLVSEVPASGYVTESEGGLTVALQTDLTDELIEEGFVREIVSKVQSMRREIDFEVTDRVDLFVAAEDKMIDLVQRWQDRISEEVLAASLTFFSTTEKLPQDAQSKDWDINGEEMTFALRRSEQNK
ncbi:MAG: isoleucine--tRNA ligase [Eubacteriales bacterium]|nr:isoleucine--tRNA ligase [Eubacteriales bacterium]MDD4324087.1 isoleucine--tRNA ligase [Eubacteriales bacterium]MDD4541233.1 isoleucine--tRNA ligase [Eubacteriales bacterium]